MGLRLATEKDCSFFCFWSGRRVLDGVNCQGDLFVVLERLPLQQQSVAYDRANWVDTIAHSGLVIRMAQEYLVCAPFQGEEWKTLLNSTPPELSD